MQEEQGREKLPWQGPAGGLRAAWTTGGALDDGLDGRRRRWPAAAGWTAQAGRRAGIWPSEGRTARGRAGPAAAGEGLAGGGPGRRLGFRPFSSLFGQARERELEERTEERLERDGVKGKMVISLCGSYMSELCNR